MSRRVSVSDVCAAASEFVVCGGEECIECCNHGELGGYIHPCNSRPAKSQEASAISAIGRQPDVIAMCLLCRAENAVHRLRTTSQCNLMRGTGPVTCSHTPVTGMVNCRILCPAPHLQKLRNVLCGHLGTGGARFLFPDSHRTGTAMCYSAISDWHSAVLSDQRALKRNGRVCRALGGVHAESRLHLTDNSEGDRVSRRALVLSHPYDLHTATSLSCEAGLTDTLGALSLWPVHL